VEIPSPEALEATTAKQLRTLHERAVSPKGAVLTLVGDLRPAAALDAVEAALGGWSGRAAKALPKLPKHTPGGVTIVDRPAAVQTNIRLGAPSLPRTAPNYAALQVANVVFGGYFSSRLVNNIREDKGYTYSPSSVFTGFSDAGFYRFAADVRNEVTGATLTEVYKEIDKMRAEGSDGAELAGAKSYMRGIFSLQTATQGGLSATLNNVYVYDLPKNYPETFRSTIAELTPPRVKAGANALLGSDASVVVIVGDWAKVKDQLGAFKDITFLDINGHKIAPPAP
jgi:zinc protease